MLLTHADKATLFQDSNRFLRMDHQISVLSHVALPHYSSHPFGTVRWQLKEDSEKVLDIRFDKIFGASILRFFRFICFVDFGWMKTHLPAILICLFVYQLAIFVLLFVFIILICARPSVWPGSVTVLIAPP